MKNLQGIALLAVVGFVTMTSGIAQAGPGCGGGKATQTGSGACTGKSTSMQSGGCGSMKASGGACTGKSASACAMKTADCEKMLRTYYQTHGWAGIESDCCMGMNAKPTVSRVSAGSPAEKAGFKTGDILTSVNGISFATENQAAVQSLMTNGMKIGDTVRYTAMRDGQIVSFESQLVKISDPELNTLIAEHVSMSHSPSQNTAKADKAEIVR
jgi:membrane-associated protease RseP (regulator of RpoE activity)